MILSDVSIKRPVFAAVISLMLVVVGVIAFSRLPLRELPNIDPPVVSIDVAYPGAAAGVVETRVTQVLEDAVASRVSIWSAVPRAMAGLRSISSSRSRAISNRPPTTYEMRSAASPTDCRKRPIRRRWLKLKPTPM